MDENGVRTSVHSYPNWNEEMVRIRAAASTNNLQTMKIYVALHSIDMRGLVTYMNMINKQTHIAPVVPLSLFLSPCEFHRNGLLVGTTQLTHCDCCLVCNENGDEHHLHIGWVIWLRANRNDHTFGAFEVRGSMNEHRQCENNWRTHSEHESEFKWGKRYAKKGARSGPTRRSSRIHPPVCQLDAREHMDGCTSDTAAATPHRFSRKYTTVCGTNQAVWSYAWINEHVYDSHDGTYHSGVRIIISVWRFPETNCTRSWWI